MFKENDLANPVRSLKTIADINVTNTMKSLIFMVVFEAVWAVCEFKINDEVYLIHAFETALIFWAKIN